MKQIIFFKKIWIVLLFVFIWNSYLPAQTPWQDASFISPGNNSCNAGQIGYSSGYFSFPVPTGLTLAQLNRLETDGYFFDNNYTNAYFQVFAQAGCGLIEILFPFSPPSYIWINSGNVASPGYWVGLSNCPAGGPLNSALYSDVQALYGSAVILGIHLWNQSSGYPVYFDNTIINNTTYNYDDCDQDGLLDIYDCAPQNNGNNKVLVCHEGNTICVAESAVAAHLAHGDYMGSCITNTRSMNNTSEGISLNDLKLYPSPASNQINIQNNSNKPLGSISIYDISGKLLYKNHIGASRAIIDIKNFSPGVYYLRSDQLNTSIKFVKQ
jgi:hypothetical protein